MSRDSSHTILAQSRRRHLHPFPARMAPQLATEALARLPGQSVVLDPMCGSGTVLQAAAAAGHRTVGFDLDPLAVLIAGVATSGISGASVRRLCRVMVDDADRRANRQPIWQLQDAETSNFVDYWFGPGQQPYLRKLAVSLHGRGGATADALRVALSRTIITKDHGASLARDVSHSRPHRVTLENSYDVRTGFLTAAESVSSWLDTHRSQSSASVRIGDARSLPHRLDGGVDVVITSPPYLNAIDYLRGHRLALVWLGHQLPSLRSIRADSIGAERALRDPGDKVLRIARVAAAYRELPDRERGMLFRYAVDLLRVMSGVARVLRADGEAVLVVGNSNLRGVFVRNSKAVSEAAVLAGLTPVSEAERELPAQHRYLPPPRASGRSLDLRMNTESVLVFRKGA